MKEAFGVKYIGKAKTCVSTSALCINESLCESFAKPLVTVPQKVGQISIP